MKQYRITSSNFVHQGESGYDDAVMDSQDLAELKRLAGIPIAEDGGAISGIMATPRAQETGIMSPLGSNPNDYNKHKIEKERNIKPGSPEWFQLWYAKKSLTGEKPVSDTPKTQDNKE